MINNPIPLITVIVAVFNGAKTMEQCIESIINQTYQNKEIIIIDGGSTDGTIELLKSNNKKITYWSSEKDKGIYNAWNKGLLQSKGDWICFLGADDYFWNAQVLENMATQLAMIPSNIHVVYSQIMLLNIDGDSLYPIGEPWEKIKYQFKQVMCIPHQGVMHRSKLFEKNGNFDESFQIAGDYEFLMRELKTGDAVFVPNLITSGMRQGGISSNPANTLSTMREFRLAQRMHGQHLPGWKWMMATARVYARTMLWRILGERVTRRLLDQYRRLMGLPSYWTKT